MERFPKLPVSDSLVPCMAMGIVLWCLWSWSKAWSTRGRSSLMLLLCFLVKVCVMSLITLLWRRVCPWCFCWSPSPLVRFQKLSSKQDFIHEMHCVSGCVALNAPPPLYGFLKCDPFFVYVWGWEYCLVLKPLLEGKPISCFFGTVSLLLCKPEEWLSPEQ